MLFLHDCMLWEQSTTLEISILGLEELQGNMPSLELRIIVSLKFCHG